MKIKDCLLIILCFWGLNLFCQEGKEYNFLFIVIDDLRPELGCYGNKYVHSPNIDGLASKSIVFTNAYVQSTICSPSRSSFLTGLRPDSTGIHGFDKHIRDVVPNVVTMPQLLKQNGYKSIGMGKIFHNNKNDQNSWTEYHDNFYGYYLNKENLSKFKATGKGPAFESEDVNDNQYKDGQMANLAVSKLREFKNDKFILSVGFIKPHLPFNAPKKYWDLYEGVELPISTIRSAPVGSPSYSVVDTHELRGYYNIPRDTRQLLPNELSKNLIRAYYACISYIDAQVGILLKELDNLGLNDNTIVILTSDHGFKLGEYNVWGKHSNTEFDTKVPLLIYHPEMEAGENNGIVEVLDLYPTIADFAGIESSSQGENLFKENRKPIAISQTYHDFVPLMGYSIRKDDYRYAFWVKDRLIIAEEYFDHRLNSSETTNQIDLLKPEERIELLREFNFYNYTNPVDLDLFALSIDNFGIVVYPNPANDQLVFSFHKEVKLENIQIIVSNLEGAKIIEMQASKYKTFANLKGHRGMLFYQISRDGRVLKNGKIWNK
jgi:iduronate 2-sulfatase